MHRASICNVEHKLKFAVVDEIHQGTPFYFLDLQKNVIKFAPIITAFFDAGYPQIFP